MRKLSLLVLAIFSSLSACYQKMQYTETSSEIDTYKKVITDYENGYWKDFVTHYADSAKILIHVTEKDAISIAQLAASDREDAKSFKSWKYTNKKYFMIMKDSGETWVYFNGLWQGTFIPNNKLYKIPAQISVQFAKGKIVREEGYWDISKVMMDIAGLQNSAQSK